jgi:hypothetical protein
MSLSVWDISEVAYGGVVTLADWWDSDRVKKAQIADKDVLKKAGFWTFAVLGLGATLMSAFGWWRKAAPVTERMSHGFLYAVPGFIYKTVQSLRATTGANTRGDAVAEAQRIIRQRQAAAAGRKTGYDVTDPSQILV